MTEKIRVPERQRKMVGPGRPRGAAAIRKRQMIETVAMLLHEGLTQQEIAERMGINQSSVSRVYRQALEFYPYKTVDQRRELMLLRLDSMAEKAEEIMNAEHPFVSDGRVVYPIVKWDNGKPVYGDKPLQDAKAPLQAINTLVAVFKRVADTIGSDAPKRVETANLHVKAEDLRVVQLVGQLQSANSYRADEIKSRVEARRSLPPGSSITVIDAIESTQRTENWMKDQLRPSTATERRSVGRGADPRRVATWNPASLYE